jgi:hypothetical protein
MTIYFEPGDIIFVDAIIPSIFQFGEFIRYAGSDEPSIKSIPGTWIQFDRSGGVTDASERNYEGGTKGFKSELCYIIDRQGVYTGFTKIADKAQIFYDAYKLLQIV